MAPINPLTALSNYQTELQSWLRQVSTKTATLEQGLALLRARQGLHEALAEAPFPNIYILKQLPILDQSLRQESSTLAQMIDFPSYRQSMSLSENHWWWYLDTYRDNRYDWCIRAARVLLWTGSLGLLGDISRRFFLGGPGVAGVSAIALSSLLTLLNARTELTTTGREGFNKLLETLKVPPHQREEARLGATTLLSLFLLGLWMLLPAVSTLYTFLGNKAAFDGRLGSAVQDLERAIALNTDNVNAHYAIGTLYEDLQQFDQAETQYRIAMQGDVPEAYNNLGRLYLRSSEPDPESAVFLLSTGLNLTEQQERELKRDRSFFSTKYSLLKNLGWARLRQSRYKDAERHLSAAVGLLQRPGAATEISNPASAHCLLAQVLDAQENEAAVASWQSCHRLGESNNPDEDSWIFQACQRLKQENLSCPNPSTLTVPTHLNTDRDGE